MSGRNASDCCIEPSLRQVSGVVNNAAITRRSISNMVQAVVSMMRDMQDNVETLS
jgi:hypothetical protein